MTNLDEEIMNSCLFDKDCDEEQALLLIEQFALRYESLQEEAEDLKQLQELLESSIVNFSQMAKSKLTLAYLKQTWKLIRQVE
jgi:hypothetical protein